MEAPPEQMQTPPEPMQPKEKQLAQPLTRVVRLPGPVTPNARRPDRPV